MHLSISGAHRGTHEAPLSAAAPLYHVSVRAVYRTAPDVSFVSNLFFRRHRRLPMGASFIDPPVLEHGICAVPILDCNVVTGTSPDIVLVKVLTATANVELLGSIAFHVITSSALLCYTMFSNDCQDNRYTLLYNAKHRRRFCGEKR